MCHTGVCTAPAVSTNCSPHPRPASSFPPAPHNEEERDLGHGAGQEAHYRVLVPKQGPRQGKGIMPKLGLKGPQHPAAQEAAWSSGSNETWGTFGAQGLLCLTLSGAGPSWPELPAPYDGGTKSMWAGCYGSPASRVPSGCRVGAGCPLLPPRGRVAWGLVLVMAVKEPAQGGERLPGPAESPLAPEPGCTLCRVQDGDSKSPSARSRCTPAPGPEPGAGTRHGGSCSWLMCFRLSEKLLMPLLMAAVADPQLPSTPGLPGAPYVLALCKYP